MPTSNGDDIMTKHSAAALHQNHIGGLAPGGPSTVEDERPDMSAPDTASPRANIFHEYLTKPEAAVEIGKSEGTLDRWHRLRVGPPRTKIGRTVMYRTDSFRAWALAQEEAPALRQS